MWKTLEDLENKLCGKPLELLLLLHCLENKGGCAQLTEACYYFKPRGIPFNLQRVTDLFGSNLFILILLPPCYRNRLIDIVAPYSSYSV